MDAVRPLKVSHPADDSDSPTDFAVYLDLYNPFIEAEIRWSEANSLAPQYLHLSEHDIGNAGAYSMKSYMAGFVNSLEYCRAALEQVVFCYSFEQSSGLLPQNCTRSQFYAFELNEPAKGDTPGEISGAILGYGRRETGRPDPRPLEGSGGLIEVLENSHLVQPYIVEMVEKLNVNCIHDIRPTTKATLDDLVDSFKRTGCYQFSIYGYKFKPDQVDRWVNSPTRRAFLEHAFILHILHWNQGLRAAHERASVFGRTLTEVRSEWDAARTQAEHVFEKLGTVVARGTQALNPDSILPLPSMALDPRNGLFRGSWGHTFAQFPKEKPKSGASATFSQFYQYVKRYSTTEGYRELGDFVEACGAASYLSRAEEFTSDQRESWEKAIFWATKLMSRRIQPNQEGEFSEDFCGIGPDQIALAILFALARSGRTDISVRVGYSGNVQDGSRDIKKQREIFLNNIRVERPEVRKFWKGWPDYAWHWLDEDLSLQWTTDGTGVTPLNAYILSGLMRSSETLYKELLLYVPGEATSKGKKRYDSFLAKLAQVVELCAKGDSHARELRLREVNIDWRADFLLGTTGTAKEKKSAIVVEICCEGVLGSRERTGTGVFTNALWGLNDFFSSSLRSDADDMVPGVYYVVRDGGSNIRIILQSVGLETVK